MSEVIDLRKEDIKILDTGKSVFTKCSETEQFGEGASVWLSYTSERVVLLNLLKQFLLMSGQIKKQVYFFRHSNFKIQDSFISHWGSNSLVFRGIVRARNPTNGKIAIHTKQILHSSIKCLDTILIHLCSVYIILQWPFGLYDCQLYMYIGHTNMQSNLVNWIWDYVQQIFCGIEFADWCGSN